MTNGLSLPRRFDHLAADVALHRPFLADFLSHARERERETFLLLELASNCTGSISQRLRFLELLRHTGTRLRALERLIRSLGGEPEHRGWMARLPVFRNHRLLHLVKLHDSLSPRMKNLAVLEAVSTTLAECLSVWKVLEQLTRRLPDAPSQRAFLQAVKEALPPLELDDIWARVAAEEETLSQLGPSEEYVLEQGAFPEGAEASAG